MRRVRTNTPLQALVTLNDPAFFEAARALADRMAQEVPARTPDAARARAAYGFRLCTSRRPTAGRDEPHRRVVREAARAWCTRRPRRAARIDEAATGRAPTPASRAAWTLVANVLLNLDETVTK